MYILFVAAGWCDASDPLEGIFELDQARALTEAGHKVVYAAVDLRSIRTRRKWGLIRSRKGNVDIYAMSLPVGPLGPILDRVGAFAIDRIYRAVLREHGRPDAVHAHFLGPASFAAGLCRREKLPLVITEHSSRLNRPDLGEKDRTKMRNTYSAAGALLTVSPSLRDNIYRNTGIEASVVPNIVDLESFSGFVQEKPEGEPFTFAASGGLIHRKGYDLLLEAMHRLCQKGYDIALRIYGDGEEKNALRSRTSELGLSERVVFRGRQPRGVIAEEYETADAFVLPTRKETFGVVYIEAMAVGLPVIATVCGGPEGFVTPETGMLIPTENVDALTEAMEYMILHRNEYKSADIAAYARQHFAPEEIARQLGEVYKRVCADCAREE